MQSYRVFIRGKHSRYSACNVDSSNKISFRIYPAFRFSLTHLEALLFYKYPTDPYIAAASFNKLKNQSLRLSLFFSLNFIQV